MNDYGWTVEIAKQGPGEIELAIHHPMDKANPGHTLAVSIRVNRTGDVTVRRRSDNVLQFHNHQHNPNQEVTT